MKNELSNDARALLESALEEDSLLPADSDRKRVDAALKLALGGAVLGASGATSAAAASTAATTAAAGTSAAIGITSTGAMLAKGALVLALVGGVGVGAVTLTSDSPETIAAPAAQVAQPVAEPAQATEPVVREAATVVDRSSFTEAAEPTPPIEPTLPAEVAAEPSARIEGPSRPSTRARPAPEPVVEEVPAPEQSPSALADEVRLLRDAQAARGRGAHERALTLLREHARRFERGALTAERDAALALTLCEAGRDAEMRVARAHFLATYPDSPLRGRVQAACAE